MRETIDPRFVKMRDWAQRMVPILEKYGTPIPFPLDENWRAWVRALYLIPGIQALQPPNPSFFNDWRVWAERFNEVLT